MSEKTEKGLNIGITDVAIGLVILYIIYSLTSNIKCYDIEEDFVDIVSTPGSVATSGQFLLSDPTGNLTTFSGGSGNMITTDATGKITTTPTGQFTTVNTTNLQAANLENTGTQSLRSNRLLLDTTAKPNNFLTYNSTLDGPVLSGNAGGKISNATKDIIAWDASANVTLNPVSTLTANNITSNGVITANNTTTAAIVATSGNTTTNGYAVLNGGGTGQNAGFVGFYKAGGTRKGYVGWDRDGYINLAAEDCLGYRTNKDLVVDGTMVGLSTMSSRLINQDTRNVNSPPSYYAARSGLTYEFKGGSVLGLPNPPPFVLLETITTWGDNSGGIAIVQTATNHNNKYKYTRTAFPQDTTWGNWSNNLEDIIGVGTITASGRDILNELNILNRKTQYLREDGGYVGKTGTSHVFFPDSFSKMWDDIIKMWADKSWNGHQHYFQKYHAAGAGAGTTWN